MKYKHNFCELENVPEEVHFEITKIMKIEKIVSTLLSYKKAGIQVIHISGFIKKLVDCPEIIKKLATDVSLFVDNPEIVPQNIRKYIENA